MTEPTAYTHPTERGMLWLVRKGDHWLLILGDETLATYDSPWAGASHAADGVVIPSRGTTAGLASDDLSDWRARP